MVKKAFSVVCTNAVAVCEAENAFHLVEGDVLLDLHHVLVEARAHPVKKVRVKPRTGGCWPRAKQQTAQPHVGRVSWGGRRSDAPCGQRGQWQARRTLPCLWKEVSPKLSSTGGRSTADADSGAHGKGVRSARIAG